MLDDQLIVTWGNICQAMRTEFEPYLAVVIPPLFKALAVGKFRFNMAGVLLITVADNSNFDLQAFMSRYLQEGIIGAMSTDNKHLAFRSLIIYCAIFQSRFAPYVTQSLELTLSTLRHSARIQAREECISWVSISHPSISCH